MPASQIISYCHIKNNLVYLNGKVLHERNASEDLSVFLSELYKLIPLSYPKFFKMDKQCKLGILAIEFLIRNTPEFESFNKNQTALVFSNNASSLESDRNHLKSISDKENYFPSPAVFVYTLPNIVSGEIALKHKITGENAFFISKRIDTDLLCNYGSILLQNQETTSLLAGWINVDGNSAEAFVYCVKNPNFNEAKEGLGLAHSAQTIQKLYDT